MPVSGNINGLAIMDDESLVNVDQLLADLAEARIDAERWQEVLRHTHRSPDPKRFIYAPDAGVAESSLASWFIPKVDQQIARLKE